MNDIKKNELNSIPDKKLEEIARLCGYNDMYYFIRVFKKKTGVTPGRYRGNR